MNKSVRIRRRLQQASHTHMEKFTTSYSFHPDPSLSFYSHIHALVANRRPRSHRNALPPPRSRSTRRRNGRPNAARPDLALMLPPPTNQPLSRWLVTPRMPQLRAPPRMSPALHSRSTRATRKPRAMAIGHPDPTTLRISRRSRCTRR